MNLLNWVFISKKYVDNWYDNTREYWCWENWYDNTGLYIHKLTKRKQETRCKRWVLPIVWYWQRVLIIHCRNSFAGETFVDPTHKLFLNNEYLANYHDVLEVTMTYITALLQGWEEFHLPSLPRVHIRHHGWYETNDLQLRGTCSLNRSFDWQYNSPQQESDELHERHTQDYHAYHLLGATRTLWSSTQTWPASIPEGRSNTVRN